MSDPMSDERLAEIRERAKYATDGPWKVDEPQRLKDASLRYVIAAEAEDVAAIDVAAEASAWRFHRKAAELDAAFIAHARQDVPALLAEVERLRAELAERDGLAARATALETDRDDLLAALAAADERTAGIRSELHGELAEVRGMYDDLCKSMSRTGDRLAAVEAERDEAREQVERVLLLTRPNDLNGGRTPAWISAADLRIALGGTEPGQ